MSHRSWDTPTDNNNGSKHTWSTLSVLSHRTVSSFKGTSSPESPSFLPSRGENNCGMSCFTHWCSGSLGHQHHKPKELPANELLHKPQAHLPSLSGLHRGSLESEGSHHGWPFHRLPRSTLLPATGLKRHQEAEVLQRVSPFNPYSFCDSPSFPVSRKPQLYKGSCTPEITQRSRKARDIVRAWKISLLTYGKAYISKVQSHSFVLFCFIFNEEPENSLTFAVCMVCVITR